ncbi:hypothetical protein [Methylocella sp.]|uniref:hypothetical protein n=1 Tax=Methylocella sp. TaxID=1978226 RepID=UPI0035B48EE4
MINYVSMISQVAVLIFSLGAAFSTKYIKTLATLSTFSGFIALISAISISAESDLKIASLNEQAAIADKKAEEIHQKNLLITLDLEREKSERLRIERSLAPRIFTNQQSKTLNDAIRGKVGRVFVIENGDVEGNHYGGLVSMALDIEKHYAGGVNRIGDSVGVGLFIVTDNYISSDDISKDPLKIGLEAAGVVVNSYGAGPQAPFYGGVDLKIKSGDRVLVFGGKGLPPDKDPPILPAPKPGEPFFFIQGRN